MQAEVQCSSSIICCCFLKKANLIFKVEGKGLHTFYFFVSPDFGHVQTLPDLNTLQKYSFAKSLFTLIKILAGLVLEFEAKLKEE